MNMFCTTIVPTIGRLTLARTVTSVLDQEFDAADFEVIVVNDSGRPLVQEEWHNNARVRIVTTYQRERSVARNTGAAMARGKYLHFLDDDDWLLPGAMDAFWQLDKVSDAAWLYGSYHTVDNSGDLVEVIEPGIVGDISALLIAGESIPFQVSLLDNACFHEVGAFDPDPAIIGVEDRDVGRRMALCGTVAHTPAIVAQIRIGEQNSSTNWTTIGESDRRGREKALCIKGAATRVRAAATSSYLHGRITRAYVASSVWNLNRHDVFTAASRAVTALSFTGMHIVSPDFWRGLRTRIG